MVLGSKKIPVPFPISNQVYPGFVLVFYLPARLFIFCFVCLPSSRMFPPSAPLISLRADEYENAESISTVL